MANLYPRWFNRLPLLVGAGVLLTGALVTAGVWYYFTPKYSRVGYQPIQPVPYSHKTHVDQLGLDCRYCHSAVDKSWYANIPSPSVCMNCHSQVLATDARLAPIRDSFKSGEPISWIQIHRTPDFVYFNHGVHVNRGVSCVSCHGQINEMVEVRHEKPLTMAFCLDCHRNPAPNLRPPEEVFNMHWTNDPVKQLAQGEKFVHDWKIMSSQNCYTCHR